MKELRAILLPVFLLLMFGCTWLQIPSIPEYAKEQPIPLRIGVIASGTPASLAYVPGVVEELKSMQLFETLIYPYREGDPVDAVTTVSVDGGWQASGFGAGFVIGLTLGIASPFLGPSMTGTYHIKAEMTCGKEDVGLYVTQASSTVKWGLMADVNEVSNKAEDLQRKRLADALAKKIRADQQVLLPKVKSSNP